MVHTIEVAASVKKPQVSYTEAFNVVLKGHHLPTSKFNAKVIPPLVTLAALFTPFKSKHERDLAVQTVIAGGIVLQVLDNSVEEGRDPIVSQVQLNVAKILEKLDFDPRVVDRIKEQGNRPLEHAKFAMQSEKSHFAKQESGYERIAGISNGTDYVASLLNRDGNRTNTEVPRLIKESNRGMRLLLDLVKVEGDIEGDAPNVYRHRAKRSPGKTMATILREGFDEIVQLRRELKGSVNSQTTPEERLFVNIFSIAANFIRFTPTLPIVQIVAQHRIQQATAGV